MNRIDANQLLNNAMIKLTAMERYYEKLASKVELHGIEIANQTQVKDLLQEVETIVKNGGVTALEIDCLSSDTMLLWREVSPLLS